MKYKIGDKVKFSYKDKTGPYTDFKAIIVSGSHTRARYVIKTLEPIYEQSSGNEAYPLGYTFGASDDHGVYDLLPTTIKLR